MKMDLERVGGRHRDNSHSFQAESEALDQIAKEVSVQDRDHMIILLRHARLKIASLQKGAVFANSSRMSRLAGFYGLCNILQAEARLAARRQARYEARNIRLKEIEKKKEEEENNQSNHTNHNNHVTSTPTATPQHPGKFDDLQRWKNSFVFQLCLKSLSSRHSPLKCFNCLYAGIRESES